MTSAIELSPSDKKHIRDASIWAVVIIAVGMLIAVAGLFTQAANQDATLAEASAYLP